MDLSRKRLAGTAHRTQICAMGKREKWARFLDNPIVEWSLFVLGVILLLLALVVGPIPGPGGIIFAGAGLALILKTSMWAKRHYARFKRWRPKILGRYFTPGRWTDLALRRRSALRRERLRKERERLAKAQQTIAGD
jgi:hypothetical protein